MKRQWSAGVGSEDRGGRKSQELEVNVENPREFLDRRQLLSALRSLRRGDFTVRLPEDLPGLDSEIAQLKDTLNTMVDKLNSFAA